MAIGQTILPLFHTFFEKSLLTRWTDEGLSKGVKPPMTEVARLL